MLPLLMLLLLGVPVSGVQHLLCNMRMPPSARWQCLAAHHRNPFLTMLLSTLLLAIFNTIFIRC
jgi:hypothetical protein